MASRKNERAPRKRPISRHRQGAKRPNAAEEASSLLRKAAAAIAALDDAGAATALGSGALDDLLLAILPRKEQGEENIYEYLARFRHRAQYIALLRHAISRNYSLEGRVDGHRAFVSPYYQQWIPDGTLFLQGEERFGGLLGLYKDGQVRFAISARDVPMGGSMEPADFQFVTIEEARRTFRAGPYRPADGLRQLRSLVERRVSDESKYQELLQRQSWMFGAAYEAIVPKGNLDDANIPDFMAIRSRDGCRDIIEIKPPTLKIFGAHDKLLKPFDDAWSQAERYLAFARRQAGYLEREKGYRFHNPRVLLVVGHCLTNEQRQMLRRNKEELNPAISVLTYEELLELARKTLEFAESMSSGPAT